MMAAGAHARAHDAKSDNEALTTTRERMMMQQQCSVAENK